MNQRFKNAIIVLIILELLLVFVGVFFKIRHFEFAEIFLLLGLVVWCGCVILAIYTIFKNNNITSSQKILWITCFFLSGVFGIALYLLVFDKQDILQKKFDALQEEQSLTI